MPPGFDRPDAQQAPSLSSLAEAGEGRQRQGGCVCTFDDGLVQEWVSKARAIARSKGWKEQMTGETTDPTRGTRCEGRYPVPQTSPPRDEPFEVTYRCALPAGHSGPCGPDHRPPPISDPPTDSLQPIATDPTRGTGEEEKDKVDSGDPRIVGNARAGEIEVRYDEPAHITLDEIVAFNAYVHLEMMSESQYALIIKTAKEHACFWIGSVTTRAEVGASESWREPSQAVDAVDLGATVELKRLVNHNATAAVLENERANATEAELQRLRHSHDAFLAVLQEKEAVEKRIRTYLWLSHGHPFAALYGDDGEMQCHHCRADYRRDDLARLMDLVEQTRRSVAVEALNSHEALLAALRKERDAAQEQCADHQRGENDALNKVEALLAALQKVSRNEAAARSALKFVDNHTNRLPHTEAVADCSHCNVSFVADALRNALDAARAALASAPTDRSGA